MLKQTKNAQSARLRQKRLVHTGPLTRFLLLAVAATVRNTQLQNVVSAKRMPAAANIILFYLCTSLPLPKPGGGFEVMKLIFVFATARIVAIWQLQNDLWRHNFVLVF